MRKVSKENNRIIIKQDGVPVFSSKEFKNEEELQQAYKNACDYEFNK